MESLENQELQNQPKKKGKASPKYKKVLLYVVFAVILTALSFILPKVISNAILTHRVQSYLDGKMFIEKSGIYTIAYSFSKNTMGSEYWCTSDKSLSGDIDEMLRYKAKGFFGSEEVQLWIKEDGKWWGSTSIKLCEDGSVEPYDGEWSLATKNEIDKTRKEILCAHEFGEDVIIKAATCTSGGETSHTCNKCGYIEKKITIALDHNYENKICTECGAKKQPQKAYDIEPNMWYTYQDVLHFQNIKLQNAFSVSQGKGMMVSYYFVCQHCHVVDETLRQNIPEFNYDINKMYTCEECGGLTNVKIELG